MTSATYTLGDLEGDSRTVPISETVVRTQYPEHKFFDDTLDRNPHLESSSPKPVDDSQE